MGVTSSQSLPYVPLGDPIATEATSSFAWTVFDACKPEEKGDVDAGRRRPTATLFRFSKKEQPEERIALARNAMRRLKTLHHPHILKFIGGEETDRDIWMVTEHAEPLVRWIQSDSDALSAPSSDGIPCPAMQWGLHTIARATAFLSQECHLVHGSIRPEAVFVTDADEWKLCGMEVCDGAATTGGVSRLWSHSQALLPRWDVSVWRAPEASGDRTIAAAENAATARDAWGLGFLVLVCATRSPRQLSERFEPAMAMSQQLELPHSAHPTLREVVQGLLQRDPARRMRPSDARSRLDRAFPTPTIPTLEFLETLPLQDPRAKREFFAKLPQVLPRIPLKTRQFRALPLLMNALEFGAAGGGGTVVFAPLLDIGRTLPGPMYDREIVPCVARLFSSPDRATRMQLLHHLPDYIDNLDEKTLNTSVWPCAAEGFDDSVATLREATLKASVQFAPRLSQENRHGSLVRCLRALLGDPEPSLRVNAAIAIGRVAEFIDGGWPDRREELLLPPLTRAMRDGFPLTRVSALKALAHLISLPTDSGSPSISAVTLGQRVVGLVGPCTVDSAEAVRKAALSALDRIKQALTAASNERARVARERAETQRQETGIGSSGPGAAATGTAPPSTSSTGAGNVSDRAKTMVVSALGWAVSGWSTPPATDSGSAARETAANTANVGGTIDAAAPRVVANLPQGEAAAKRQVGTSMKAMANSRPQARNTQQHQQQRQPAVFARSGPSGADDLDGWDMDDDCGGLDLLGPEDNRTATGAASAKERTKEQANAWEEAWSELGAMEPAAAGRETAATPGGADGKAATLGAERIDATDLAEWGFDDDW